jgi:hypothetical protein
MARLMFAPTTLVWFPGLVTTGGWLGGAALKITVFSVLLLAKVPCATGVPQFTPSVLP